MLYWVGLVCLVLYLICSLWFLLSSTMQVHLLLKARGPKPAEPILTRQQLPFVTIQVPVYNERYVIRRLLNSLGELDYPKQGYEIQVLDDSTDDTSDIIRTAAESLRRKGVEISILRRNERPGYKAGALQAGLPFCKGSLIAIFDADFTPNRYFLRNMSRHFSDPNVGGVQGRWGHRNLHENWLTVIQTYLLDSHFTLEQQGRYASGYYVNFNGTAGMWRKECIEQCGGWNGNVLTEDLELSYRAQLKGWRFVYDNSISVPADLPVDVEAFKVQQFRWAKGMAQSAAIHLKDIFGKPIRAIKKVHAVFHLMSSVSFLAVLGNILLALPVIIGRHYSSTLHEYSGLIVVTGITVPIICIYYYAGTRGTLARKDFWLHLPAFLVVYMALSAQNSIAVIQGWLGRHSPFVRTPKPDKPGTSYNDITYHWSATTLFEIAVLLYIIITIIVCIVWRDFFLLPFLVMAMAGLLVLLRPALSFGQKIQSPSEPSMA